MNTADDDRVSRLEERLAALDRLIEAQFDARDQALQRVRDETERVRAQQNEWRQTVNDITATKLDRSEYEQGHAELIRRVEDNHTVFLNRVTGIEKRIDERAGAIRGSEALRSALFVVAGLVIAATAVVVALVR